MRPVEGGSSAVRRSVAIALSLCAVLAGCASDTHGLPMAINDPLDLIDDVDPGALRLFVLPAPSYACDDTAGVVTPEVPDLPQGMLEEAVADLTLEVAGSRATAEIEVAGGEYVVFVRGKGTDPVSGRPDQVIARGCATTTLEAGQTREVRLTLIPVVGMGECGDGVLSPDEQCEDGNTTGGDGCSESCRTEPFVINTTTAGVQNHPTVGGARGQRWVIAYDSDNAFTLLRLLSPDGGTIASPSALMTDAGLDSIFGATAMGFELLSSVAVSSSGRFAIAYTDFGGGPPVPDVRTGFLDANRSPEGGASGAALVRDGAATQASVAFAADGSALVAFEDGASSTGLSGAVFASGSMTPAAEPFEVGQGASSASAPAVAGVGDGFVVAFQAGGDVFVQRFGTDGAARDASAVLAGGGAGTQTHAAVGGLTDGRFLVAFEDGDAAADGSGTAVRARAFGADGAAAGDPFTLNTTTEGDQGSPAVAAGNEAFAVVFESAGALRARLVSGGGEPVPNRAQPPTTADFEVSPSGAEPAVAAGGPSDTSLWLAVWTQADDIRGRLFPLP